MSIDRWVSHIDSLLLATTISGGFPSLESGTFYIILHHWSTTMLMNLTFGWFGKVTLAGIEPVTFWLCMWCSTHWAKVSVKLWNHFKVSRLQPGWFELTHQRTSAPTRPHAIALTLTQQLHSLHWTDLTYLMDTQLTIHMYLLLFLVSPTCPLLCMKNASQKEFRM